MPQIFFRSKSVNYQENFFSILSRRRSLNKKIEIKEFPLKMTHAEAASLCTKAVLNMKGDKSSIDKECKKVRDLYFSLYVPSVEKKIGI